VQLLCDTVWITLCDPPGVQHTVCPTVTVTTAGENTSPGVVMVTSHSAVGWVDGVAVGAAVGVKLGPAVGNVVGASVGTAEGDTVGAAVGCAVGTAIGAIVIGITRTSPTIPEPQCGPHL